MRVPILMYHEVVRNAPASTPGHYWDQRYVLTVEQFASQMRQIAAGGFKGRTLDDCVEISSRLFQEDSVVITFDDGWASDYHVSVPVLKHLGLRATFYPVVERIGTPGYITWEELKEISSAGMVIGSHSMTHRFFSDLSESELRWELETSKKVLENFLGREVRHLSLPGGREHPRLKEMASGLGYQTICTSRYGLNSPSTNRMQLRRVAIKQSIRLSQFKRILDQNRWTLWKGRSLTASRDFLKRFLGNRVYLSLRSVLSRIHNNQSGRTN